MKFKIICTLVLIIISQNLFAQNNDANKFLEKLDLTGFKNKSFLNKAVLDSVILEKIRKKEKDEMNF